MYHFLLYRPQLLSRFYKCHVNYIINKSLLSIRIKYKIFWNLKVDIGDFFLGKSYKKIDMYVIGMIYGHALCNPLEREIIYCVGGETDYNLSEIQFYWSCHKTINGKKGHISFIFKVAKNNVFLWHRKKRLKFIHILFLM